MKDTNMLLIPNFKFLILNRCSFFNEHDWNIIPYFKQQFAGITDKPGFRIIQIYVAFAFGAGQNVKKFFTYRHGHFPFKIIKDCCFK